MQIFTQKILQLLDMKKKILPDFFAQNIFPQNQFLRDFITRENDKKTSQKNPKSPKKPKKPKNHIVRFFALRFLRVFNVIKKQNKKHKKDIFSLEFFASMLFGLCAVVCIIAVIIICVFLFGNAIPTIFSIGVSEFLFGEVWQPLNEVFGIFPMIVGSLYVTALAILFGVPFGILCAIYLAYFSRQNKIITPLVELMAGIPSIVYGFFGLIVIVPFFAQVFDTNGKGLISASILLAMMILPTIILVSKTSIEAVSKSYYEGAIALGASKERAVFFVVLKDAKSGILASVILGVGRAIGEAMAVIVIAGNQPIIPTQISDGLRTLTTNIVLELGYASGIHRDALIASSAVLFVFILLINMCFLALKKKS